MKQVKHPPALSIEKTPRPAIVKEDHTKPRMPNLMAVTLAALALVLGVATAQAQTQKSVASIPFDFQVGARHMPAGPYAVSTSDGYLLTVQGLNTPDKVFVMTNSIGSKHPQQESRRLVFLRSGDQYYLAEVWSPDLQDGRRIQAPKDREIEEASNGGGNQEATIAMALH